MTQPTQIELLQALLRKGEVHTKPRTVEIAFQTQEDKAAFRDLIWGIRRSGDKNTPRQQKEERQ